MLNHTQACLRCRKQKRKCDKLLPVCSLCKRLKHICCYSDPHGSPETLLSLSLPVPDLVQLTPTNICHTLKAQVFTIVGNESDVRQAADQYFRTIHTWLPVVAEDSYYERLSRIRTQSTTAEFSLLTLCIFLLGAVPVNGEIPIKMQSLYTLVKSYIATLDAIGINSLDMLQCRLLLTIFEVGHGMYPTAYISMGANVRAAEALGLNVPSHQQLERIFKSPERAEEAQHTWRGIVITDRYVSLESGKGPSLTKGPLSESVGGHGDIKSHKPSNQSAQLDQFTKLAQASRLLEQVLTHVYDSTSYDDFNAAEAIQVLRTFASFLATLQEEETAQHILWSSAVAVCRSALMTILEFGYHIKKPDSEYCITTSRILLESVVEDVVHMCNKFTANTSIVNLDVLPVFIPHSIYKTAVILVRDLRHSHKADSISFLKHLLNHIGMRWMAGRHYLEELERELMA